MRKPDNMPQRFANVAIQVTVWLLLAAGVAAVSRFVNVPQLLEFKIVRPTAPSKAGEGRPSQTEQGGKEGGTRKSPQ